MRALTNSQLTKPSHTAAHAGLDSGTRRVPAKKYVGKRANQVAVMQGQGWKKEVGRNHMQSTERQGPAQLSCAAVLRCQGALKCATVRLAALRCANFETSLCKKSNSSKA